jgi:hypothetical protein
MPDESMNVATADDHGHRMRTLPTPWLGMVVVPAGVQTLRGSHQHARFRVPEKRVATARSHQPPAPCLASPGTGRLRVAP